MHTLDRDCETISRAAIFQEVHPDAAAALLSMLEPCHFETGTTVYRQGQHGDRLFIVISGKVKVGRFLDDGRHNLLTIAGPSDMFGELSVFDPGPRTSSATAVTDVRAISMGRDTLNGWLRGRPEITGQLLRVLARRLRRTNNALADLIFTDVLSRVAKQLLSLATQFGSAEGRSITVPHDLTQEEIAQLVGASRETVNKALSDFVRRGWIEVNGRSVVIRDRSRLARRCGMSR